MGSFADKSTDPNPATAGTGRALSPALEGIVRLLAEVAVEKYLDEAVFEGECEVNCDQRSEGAERASEPPDPRRLWGRTGTRAADPGRR